MTKTIDLENHKSRLLEDPGKGTVYADLCTYGKTIEFNAFYLEPGEGLKIDRLNGRLYSKATHTQPDATQKFKTLDEGIVFFNQFITEIEKSGKNGAKEQAEPEKQEEIPFDQVEVTNEGVASVVNHDEEKTAGFLRRPKYLLNDLKEIKSNILKLNDTEAHKTELIRQLDNASKSLDPLQVTSLLWVSDQDTVSFDLLKNVIDPSLEYHQMYEIAKLAADIKDKPISRLKDVVVNTNVGVSYEAQRALELNQTKRNIVDLDEDITLIRPFINLLDKIQDALTNEQIHMLYMLSSRDDITFKAINAAVNVQMDPPQMKAAAELAISNKEMSFDDIESIVFQQQPETERLQNTMQEDSVMINSDTIQKTQTGVLNSRIDDNIEQAKSNIAKLEDDESRKVALLAHIDSIRDGMNEEQAYELYFLSTRKDITVDAMETATDLRLSAVQMNTAVHMALNNDGISPDAIRETILATKHQSVMDFLASRQEFTQNLDTLEKAGASKESIEQAAEMYVTAERDTMDAEANIYKMSVEEALEKGKIQLIPESNSETKSMKDSDKAFFDNANKAILSYFRGMRDSAVDFIKKIAEIPRRAAKEVMDKTVNAVDHFQDNVQNAYETKFLDYTKKKEIEANALVKNIKEQMDQLEEKHKGRVNALYHIDGLRRFVTGKGEISKEEFAEKDSIENNRQMKKLRQRYGIAMNDVTHFSNQRKELEKSIENYHEKWEKHKFGSDLNEKVEQAAKAAEKMNEQAKNEPVMDQKEQENDAR